jgi:hypothetical protein
MEDTDLRKAAIARLEAKREFWGHLFVYLAVNALLVVVWATTHDGGYFWPIWPIAGWGIGLLVHAFETFRHPIDEAAIQREMEKVGSRG